MNKFRRLQEDMAQCLFVLGAMLAMGGIILIPGVNFMERLASSIAYVAVAAMFMIVGWLWLKLIETKEREEQM